MCDAGTGCGHTAWHSATSAASHRTAWLLTASDASWAVGGQVDGKFPGEVEEVALLGATPVGMAVPPVAPASPPYTPSILPSIRQPAWDISGRTPEDTVTMSVCALAAANCIPSSGHHAALPSAMPRCMHLEEYRRFLVAARGRRRTAPASVNCEGRVRCDVADGRRASGRAAGRASATWATRAS